MHGPTCIFWANLTTFSLQRRIDYAETLEKEKAAVQADLDRKEAQLQGSIAQWRRYAAFVARHGLTKEAIGEGLMQPPTPEPAGPPPVELNFPYSPTPL